VPRVTCPLLLTSRLVDSRQRSLPFYPAYFRPEHNKILLFSHPSSPSPLSPARINSGFPCYSRYRSRYFIPPLSLSLTLFVALIISRSFTLLRTTTTGRIGHRYYVLYYIIGTVVNEAIDRLRFRASFRASSQGCRRTFDRLPDRRRRRRRCRRRRHVDGTLCADH
jgi:hypothetical protein